MHCQKLQLVHRDENLILVPGSDKFYTDKKVILFTTGKYKLGINNKLLNHCTNYVQS